MQGHGPIAHSTTHQRSDVRHGRDHGSQIWEALSNLRNGGPERRQNKSDFTRTTARQYHEEWLVRTDTQPFAQFCQIWEALSNLRNGGPERRQNKSDFTRTTARQYHEEWLVRTDTQPFAQFCAAHHKFGAFEHGVADKDRRKAVFFEKRRLEGQERQHEIETASHSARAICPAGPHLRRDIVDRLDCRVESLQAFCDAMRKVRTVDKHDSIRPCANGDIAYLSYPPEDDWDLRHDFV